MLNNFENPLRFDKVMVVSFWLTFLAHPVDGVNLVRPNISNKSLSTTVARC